MIPTRWILFVPVTTPDDCSSNCYRAIAVSVLSCFTSVENMVSAYGMILTAYIALCRLFWKIIFGWKFITHFTDEKKMDWQDSVLYNLFAKIKNIYVHVCLDIQINFVFSSQTCTFVFFSGYTARDVSLFEFIQWYCHTSKVYYFVFNVYCIPDDS